MSDETRRPNRLIDEKSPYLQQHAYNPVEWYPWGEEAFALARSENRPIFLSIGYSTCHWCHVMERESFEDEETARIMNELFVNIKVDREERPDVDNVYMTAAQAINGNGGWPLSAWLTPELKPFYVGTYFPPRAAYGRPSFRDALQSLANAWRNEPDKVERTSGAIMKAIERNATVVGGMQAPEADLLAARCYEQLEHSYDTRFGGFSGAPKFPRPAIMEFLLRYHAHTGNTAALEMTLHTLARMASGGMYDQLGGGFARYSVDAEWRVPHFEKMLYDQGQLLVLYADAFRIAGNEALAATVRHTIDYLERDLVHSDGLFYSAEDADSEGEEGTFYVWTLRELAGLITPEQLAAVEQYYGLSPEGNFEHGRNVLHVSATHEQVARRMSAEGETIDADGVERLLRSARETLFAARLKRVRPHRDEKIIAAWNGLAISGLARAATALDEPRYALLARRAADALLGTMMADGVLMRRRKDDETRIDGFLDDYAFVAAGLIDLYEATFEARYLRAADELVRAAGTLFWDEDAGGYFMTSGRDASVLVRSKGDHDGAEPAGNSVMAMNLLRLGRIFHDDDLLERAQRTIALFTARIAEYPIMMPLMVAAALELAAPPRQIVVAAGDDPDATERLLRQVRERYRPGTALLFVPVGGPDAWLAERCVAVEAMGPLDGKAAAYVCENFVCRRPVTDLAEAESE